MKDKVKRGNNDMSFLCVLTLLFIILKVFGFIAWSWWLVWLPLIIQVIIWILVFVISIVSAMYS